MIHVVGFLGIQIAALVFDCYGYGVSLQCVFSVVVAILKARRKGQHLVRKEYTFCFQLMVSVYNGNICWWDPGFYNHLADGVFNFALGAGIRFCTEQNRF